MVETVYQLNSDSSTHPRGGPDYILFVQERKESKRGHDLPGAYSQRRLVSPPELSWIPPPASPRRGVGPTRWPLTGERGDKGAGRDRH